jgi:hypothetical protein
VSTAQVLYTRHARGGEIDEKVADTGSGNSDGNLLNIAPYSRRPLFELKPWPNCPSFRHPSRLT